MASSKKPPKGPVAPTSREGSSAPLNTERIDSQRRRDAPPAGGFQRQVYSQPPFSRQPQSEERSTTVTHSDAPLLDSKLKLGTVGEPQVGTAVGLGVEGGGEVGSFVSQPSPGGVEIEVPTATIGITTRKPKISAGRRSKKVVVIRGKEQVISLVHALIIVLEEATDYVPLPQQNQKQPDLFGDLNLSDPVAREDIRELVEQLKRLNAFLDKTRSPKTTSKPVVDVKKHLNTFLGRYATTVGVGAGILTIAVGANLLHHFGVDFSVLPIPFGRKAG